MLEGEEAAYALDVLVSIDIVGKMCLVSEDSPAVRSGAATIALRILSALVYTWFLA